MFAETFIEIRKSLLRASKVRTFVELATRHRPLAPYESPTAVVAALAPSSLLTVEERDAILVALLAELHLTKHALLQSILVLAFEPLIVRVRARLGHPKVVRFGRSMTDDLDQRVLLAFLEAAHAAHVTSHAARMLRLGLERRIAIGQGKEREAPETGEFDDDKYVADPFEISTGEKATACEVVRIIEAEGGEDLCEMMLATRGNRESLRAYVARAYPELGEEERNTAYRRLAEAATKMEQKLRARSQRRNQRRLTIDAA
jgi:hypothetical protein